MQNELLSVKAEKSTDEGSLKNQLRDSQQTVGSTSDRKYEELMKQHEELKTELREQEEVYGPWLMYWTAVLIGFYRSLKKFVARRWNS